MRASTGPITLPGRGGSALPGCVRGGVKGWAWVCLRMVCVFHVTAQGTVRLHVSSYSPTGLTSVSPRMYLLFTVCYCYLLCSCAIVRNQRLATGLEELYCIVLYHLYVFLLYCIACSQRRTAGLEEQQRHPQRQRRCCSSCLLLIGSSMHYCIVLHCMYCTVLHYIVLYAISDSPQDLTNSSGTTSVSAAAVPPVYCLLVPVCITVLYCIILHCAIVYCTTVYYIVYLYAISDSPQDLRNSSGTTRVSAVAGSCTAESSSSSLDLTPACGVCARVRVCM